MNATSRRRSRFDIYRLGGQLATGAALIVVAAMILPTFIVVPISFSPTRFFDFPPETLSLKWYRAYFSVPEWTRATGYSLVVASLTTLAALALGIPAAFGLVRGRFWGRRLMLFAFSSPLMIPVILIAIAEYFFFASLGLAGTTVGLVIAHTTFSLPFVVIIMVAVLRDFDRSYERAAMSLGANPILTLWHVTLPLIRPAVVSAGLLAALSSMNEFLISLFIVAIDRVTLPIQFWKGIRFEMNPTIAAVATMWTTLTIVILLLLESLRWRARQRDASRSTTAH